MASASDTTSSGPWPPDGTRTALRPCWSHSLIAVSMRPRSSGVGSSPLSPAPWMMM